jgi:hypothetical protein
MLNALALIQAAILKRDRLLAAQLLIAKREV